MVSLGVPNPALPGKKRPNNGLPFTAPSATTYRSNCKVCGQGIYTGDKAVWGRGQLVGLIHEPCATRAGATTMPAAADGRHVAPLPEEVARPEHAVEPTALRSYGGALTDRQLALLQLLADGRSIAQIAEAQNITAQTVYNTLRNARLRIGGANHDELLDIARQRGLIKRKRS